MAKKKYNNVSLEQNELTPVTIGAFESRKKSSIGIVIIIALFGLAMVFLPEISSKLNELLNPASPINPPTTPKPVAPSETEDPDTNEETKFYPFSEGLEIKGEEINLSDFELDKEEGILKYSVINASNTYQDIEALNYYLEIYTSEKVLIERVKLVHELNLASGAFKTVNSSISKEGASSLDYLVLVKKSTSDYPPVNLANTEEGGATLTCTKEHEKAVYKFIDSKLTEMSHEYRYENSNEDYLEVSEEAKKESSSINNKSGITSTYFEYEGGFNITSVVNLNEASRGYIFHADTFKLDTEPKVVKFEMEAQNFKCS